jgi:hypothetical protein
MNLSNYSIFKSVNGHENIEFWVITDLVAKTLNALLKILADISPHSAISLFHQFAGFSFSQQK